MKEEVVLINENNEVLGTEEKLTVHTGDTKLHRGFSLFLFNSKNELLLQQRSKFKITWPKVWSNTVCGHPMLDETPEHASQRRLKYELNVDLNLEKFNLILPSYRYKYTHLGIVENEICPVVVALADIEPQPNPSEVMDFRWVDWQSFLDEISKPNSYTEWCVEESGLLNKNNKFNRLINQNQLLASNSVY